MSKSFEALCELAKQHPSRNNPQQISTLENKAAELCHDLSLEVSRAKGRSPLESRLLLKKDDLEAAGQKIGILPETIRRLLNPEQTGIEIKSFSVTLGDMSEVVKRALIGIAIPPQRKELSVMYDIIGWHENEDNPSETTHVKLFDMDNTQSPFYELFNENFSNFAKCLVYAVLLETLLNTLQKTNPDGV